MMDVNHERAMRLLVALLKITGPFEVQKDVIEDPDSYADMVIYVEPGSSGTQETLTFSVKSRSEVAG